MTTELAIIEDTSLALSPEQHSFTPAQIAALRHIGVEHAGDGDLQVFHHVCQRTGLDPFARQIYMIGRESSERDESGGWRKVVKQTIQTGIDGYRLIGHRAARRESVTVSVPQVEWAHEDGTWRPVWSKSWGMPVAARATIEKAGKPFVAIALFDEYAQTKRNGDLTQMWAQRPAGQLAKCAEALAWRMAFPQDLSGIYTDDEMGQADDHQPAERITVEQTAPAADRMAAMLGTQTSGAEVAPEATPSAPVEPESNSAPEPDPITSGQLQKIGILCGELGLADPAEARREVGAVVGREIKSRKELTKAEAHRVIERFESIQAQPFPDESHGAQS